MLSAIFDFFAELFGTVILDRLLNRDKRGSDDKDEHDGPTAAPDQSPG
jgi:hypothetical protein